MKALEPFFNHPLFWSFGINCVSSYAVEPLLNEINRELAKLPAGKRVPKLLAYPNSGEVFSFDTYTWSGQSEDQMNEFVELAEKWVTKQGVSVIGGCCRINTK